MIHHLQDSPAALDAPGSLDAPPRDLSARRRDAGSSLCISLHPILGVLLKLLSVLLVLVRDRGLNGIIDVRLDHEGLNQAQYCDDFVRRFPFVWAQQTKAHGTLVVVADVGVINLCSEADDWRLEGVLVREIDLELEMAALGNGQYTQRACN